MKSPIHYFLLVFTLLIAGVARAEDPAQLTFIFQKQKNPALMKPEAEQVASFLSKELEMPVSAQIPSDYAASVQALVSKKADIAYVDSMAFLLARRDGNASLLLAEERIDTQGSARTDYDSVFVVRKDSELKTYEDLVAKAKDLRFAFTSPTSTSGYIMPYSRFVKSGLIQPHQDPKEVFKSVSFGGSYVQALEQVVNDRADVCAVSYYAIEGDSAKQYLPETQRNSLRVLARTPGVPTHVIATRGGLSDGLREKIRVAITKLSTTHPELLKDVYGAGRFVEVDENKHVATAADAVKNLNVKLDGLVKS